MSNTQTVLTAIKEKPGTIDELAERLDMPKAKVLGAVSYLNTTGKLNSEKTDGKGAPKRYSVAPGIVVRAPKADVAKKKKPAKKKAAKRASPKPRAIAPAPTPFRCGITHDHCLLVVEPDTRQFREFTPEQTSAIADLVLQQFDA